MVVLEGCDYSATSNSDWTTLAIALKAAGIAHVGRYAVNDKSPSGRGISRAEYVALRGANLSVFIYWEGAASWMLGGYAAGVSAAQNAQANLIAEGIPQNAVIYFACDIDTTPEQQSVIDDCLRGCASVIGAGRVGVYGSFYVCQRCSTNGTAKWFAQTSAWSGGQWFAGNHLEQYGYNLIINNVNCDNVRALQANFGQVDFASTPAPTPKPVPGPAPKPPAVTYPEGLDSGIAARAFGSVKASNGITVTYSEGDELSALWLASGSYGRIVDVGVYVDSPTITRLVWFFSDGQVYHRPNANAPITLIKAA